MTEERNPHADDPNWGYHPWQVGISEEMRHNPDIVKRAREQAEAGRKAHEATCEYCRCPAASEGTGGEGGDT